MHYIKEDAERLAILASPTYSATITPPSTPIRFLPSPLSPLPAHAVLVRELNLGPETPLKQDTNGDAGSLKSAGLGIVLAPNPTPVSQTCLPPPPSDVKTEAYGDTKISSSPELGECQGFILSYYTNNNKNSSSGGKLAAFGRIKVTDTSQMVKNRQDPEETTRGDEWLCGCCGELNPADGRGVCVCGDVAGKKKHVVLYEEELQKAANRCDSNILSKVLVRGLRERNRPIGIQFDIQPIPLSRKLKKLGKCAQVKAVNISLAQTPYKSTTRKSAPLKNQNVHKAAVHLSRVIPIVSKPVSVSFDRFTIVTLQYLYRCC